MPLLEKAVERRRERYNQEETTVFDIDELGELVRYRRTVRGYLKDRDVPEEAIQKILDIARWSPSAGNGQPWEFIVVRDAEMRERIADLYARQREDKIEMDRVVRGKSASTTAVGFRRAPVYIVVVGDPRVNEAYPIRTNLEKGNQHFISGLASTVLLIHLAAAALGLGSQWVSDANSPYMGTMLKAWLGIPDPLRIYELIPVGHSASRPNPSPRRPQDEIVHYERYDQSRARSDEDVRRFVGSATLQGKFSRSSPSEGEGD